MANVVEELLVKIGIDVDSSGLKDVRNIQDKVGKSATSASKQLDKSGQSVKKQTDFLRRNRVQVQRGQEDQKNQADLSKKQRQGLGASISLFKKLGVVAAGALVAKKFNDYSNSLSNAGAENSKFAREVGISAEALQAAQFAGERENVTAEEMTGILATLNQQIGELAIGGGSQGGMSMLGLSARKANGDLKTSLELMLDLLSATEKMTPQVRAQRLGALGVGGLARLSGDSARQKFDVNMAEGLKKGFEQKETLTAAENLADAQQDAAVAWKEATEDWRRAWTEIKAAFFVKISDTLQGSSELRKARAKETFVPSMMPVAGAPMWFSRKHFNGTGGTGEVNINVNVDAQTSDEKKIAEAVGKELKQVSENVMKNREGGTQ